MAVPAFNACDYLLRPAEDTPGRLAITGPGGDLTYGELAARVRDVAAGLRELGLRPEERVVLFMADGPAMAAAILGAMRMGAVPVPVSTMLTGGELAALLDDSRARILLVSDRFADNAAKAAARIPGLTVVVDGDAIPGAVRYADLVERGHKAADDPAPYATSPDSSGLWLYTSGTTGTPKGAIHRHANIAHVVESYGRQVLGIRPEDRCYSVAKLFFAYGIGNSLFFPLATAATTILDPDPPTPAGVGERLRTYRPTLFFAVPTFYAALLRADLDPEVFSSVRRGVSAGEPLPAELCRSFKTKYGVEIIDGIGSTECLHIFLSNRPGEVRPGTTGVPVPGYELRVVDDAGRDVEPGTPGSLLVKGASIATGYWCRTDVTRRVFQGEWLHTGDTYVVDDDGYYTCLGRTNDMLKVGGIWVSPAEVEARLLEHAAVAMAAVVGLPDADGLDKPVACVVPAEGAEVDADELIAFCRAGLASFKRPREVLVVDDLPTTPTGKLRRFAVRDLAAKMLQTLDA